MLLMYTVNNVEEKLGGGASGGEGEGLGEVSGRD